MCGLFGCRERAGVVALRLLMKCCSGADGGAEAKCGCVVLVTEMMLEPEQERRERLRM